MQIRKRINSLIDPHHHNEWSSIYDIIMLMAIIIGVLPLMFRSQNILFWWFDLISGLCFILDYLLRWSIADYRLKKKSWKAFFIYPFTPMAIIDLLSILPIFNLLDPTFKVVRFSRLLKILRIFKIIHYFEPLEIVVAVIRKQSKILCTVLSFALFYIFVTALIMFNAEEDINPETGQYLFDSFCCGVILLCSTFAPRLNVCT